MYPEHQTVKLGGMAIFNCTSYNLPEWSKYSEADLPHNAFIDGVYNLVIENVAESNAGYYVCVNSNKSSRTFEGAGLLNVESKSCC